LNSTFVQRINGRMLEGFHPAVRAWFEGRYGTPTEPQALGWPRIKSGHDTLIYSSVQGNDVWRVLEPRGETVTVPVTPRLRSNNLSAVLAAARSDMGIAALPWYVAADSLAAGAIVEVLKDHSLPEQEIHAVYPSPKLVPQKVQAFIAILQGRFDGRWWEGLPKG